MYFYELELYKHFKSNVRTQTSIDFLATIWHCSTRHAKTQIHLLHQQQVIEWETKRGRGKKPFLTLLRDPISVLIDVMQILWHKSKYEEAFQIAKKMELFTHPKIQQWLNVKFGLQNEKNLHIFRHSMYFVELCLDPVKALSRHDHHVLEQIHETLFYIDEKGNARKNLLFHVNNEDFVQWHFILRKGIQFHNLQEVTATDVVSSLKTAAHLYSHSLKIKDIQEVNRYEVYITLNSPCALLPYFLSRIRFAITPADGTKNIGCGPFSLIEQSKRLLKLEAFPQYFKHRPWIDLVEIVYNNQFLLDSIRYEPFEASVPNRKIITQELGADFICLNAQFGELQGKDKREYIWHLIEPSQFIIYPLREDIAYSWIIGDDLFNLPKPSYKPIFTKPLVIGYQQIRQGVNHEEKAKILQQLLKSVGIHSTLKCIDFKEKQVNLHTQIDLFIGGIALGHNIYLALINVYLAEPKIISTFMESQQAKYVRELLQTFIEKNDNFEIFKDIERYIQENYVVKFLTHRKHIVYLREDTPYKHVIFDKNGRIDYRNMYYLEEA
ncbi:SgrR family transcriptional regulator [Cytobacillus sp. Sa5YUA1]|uniref:SgrR family transcriptional regulator n=1 Tax=Cytobacillus stercorigallinarum TaxID=2762240 RepID=A0ABR8QPF1_9BACI|nr:ABC transporter substrate-binding protein [Cytobacillus stercorigallinarum]MBD7937289.1 SgrR family transcriptional regulator [Cytobacillus stercorigallinarum]